MPLSYCKQIIAVMTDLQVRRKNTAAFAGKQGFVTLRDLFRWGERYRLAPDTAGKFYDWSQHLADEGYLVLAAKVRRSEEAEEIRRVHVFHLFLGSDFKDTHRGIDRPIDISGKL
jgi:midasin